MHWLLLILLVSACSMELPAFANPPDPPDAGADGEDAGAGDAGRD